MEKSELLVSIIIPAYNEEHRLHASLNRVAAFVQKQSYPIEVVVVDDGSQDATPAIAEQFASQYPFISLLRVPHGGKGSAIRAGVNRGQGQYLVICDADLAVPIEELPKFLPPALDSYDVAIASREVKGANRFNEPYYRHLMGRVYNLLVRLMAVPQIQDTQCGFKAFRRDAARELFALQTIDGWGIDVEVLFIAQRFGLKIVEVPVNWYYGKGSKVRPVQDTINMVRDLLRVRRNAGQGRYERKP
ncbi:MAG: glycosyltransferase family 2 protein [Anaerolineae bacterium]|nr:glycosyltransferase family 2 protein [Anaerolineae bacterium]